MGQHPSFVGCNQNIALIPAGHRSATRRCPRLRAVENAVAISQQVSLEPNPKTAVTVGHQTENALTVLQSRSIAHKVEAQPIETNETGLSADPEIAISG